MKRFYDDEAATTWLRTLLLIVVAIGLSVFVLSHVWAAFQHLSAALPVDGKVFRP